MSRFQISYDKIRRRFVFPVLLFAVCVLAIAAVIGFIYHEPRTYWFIICALGTSTLGNLGNCIAMRANGNQMPVITRAPNRHNLDNGLHVLAGESVRYRFLVDRYHLGSFGVASLGDILTAIGFVSLVILVLRALH